MAARQKTDSRVSRQASQRQLNNLNVMLPGLTARVPAKNGAGRRETISDSFKE
jgi:hypothetical protein